MGTKIDYSRIATLTLTGSEKELKIVYQALYPELEKEFLKTKIKVIHESERLVIKIETVDTSTLRAVLNTLLRWIKLISEVISVKELRS